MVIKKNYSGNLVRGLWVGKFKPNSEIASNNIIYTGTVLQKLLLPAAIFPLFAIAVLIIDSGYFHYTYFNGRLLTNILSVAYFLMMFYVSGMHLRKLMFGMVFLSYIGELLCCKLLGMYAYRGNVIPLYVPFGHALVYASGYVMSHTVMAKKNKAALSVIFPIIFISMFICSCLFFGDIFSLFFGVFFFFVMRSKRWDNMYYFITLIALFVEFTGVSLGCWTWDLQMFGIIPSGNPPVGAVFLYAAGDVMLAKIVSLWDKRNS